MKTILVTGANRGIGFEICRQLDLMGHQVILGSRDLLKGQEAAMKLSDRITVKQLDVTEPESVALLYDYFSDTFGKLDVLINNAALGESAVDKQMQGISSVIGFIDLNLKPIGKIARKLTPALRKAGALNQRPDIINVEPDHIRKIMETNFYSALSMIQVFIPLLEKSNDGRIINISSGNGQLKNLPPDYPAYSLSKAGLNAMTIMFSKALETKGIKVNAMCPGWVKTDMGGPNAPRNVDEGAQTAIWLATEPQIPTGKFFRDCKVIEW